jgi:hypothetical protein
MFGCRTDFVRPCIGDIRLFLFVSGTDAAAQCLESIFRSAIWIPNKAKAAPVAESATVADKFASWVGPSPLRCWNEV